MPMGCNIGKSDPTRRFRIPHKKILPNPLLIKGRQVGAHGRAPARDVPPHS